MTANTDDDNIEIIGGDRHAWSPTTMPTASR